MQESLWCVFVKSRVLKALEVEITEGFPSFVACVHRSHTPPTQPNYVWYKSKKNMDNLGLNLPQRLDNLYSAQQVGLILRVF